AALAVEARRYDIPAGPLSAVVPAFERVSGVHLTLPADAVLAISSPGISGTLTVDQALAAMLAGTDLTFRILGPTAALLEFRTASESVQVTAERPGANIASPKYTEPLRDVPQTITVIPRAVMEEQGAATLRDVMRNVTGITFQAGEGGTPAGDQLTIRGFSARTDLFIDGVRDFGGYAPDTFNVEPREGADVRDCRPRLDGRLGEPREQDADAGGFARAERRRRQRRSQAGHRGSQPADFGAERRVVARERDVDRHRRARARRRDQPRL